jgi:hypothetical protein
MSTRTLSSIVTRLAIGAACALTTAGCGGEMLRTGRAAVFLTVDRMEAQPGGGTTTTSFLLSDVQVIIEEQINGQTVFIPTIFNDNLIATIHSSEKNETAVATNRINAVTLTRYHIEFRRTDGRNRPGIDVPYAFDGGMGVTIAAGSAQEVGIPLVRHQAKLEPPLANLVGGGGAVMISTIAEVTFYGHDQNGNEVQVTGRIDVQFGDFGDDQ